MVLIFVIGAPGAGKGTLCKMWCQSAGYEHVSIGDHLRELAQNGLIEQHLKDKIEKSELLATEDITAILRDKIAALQERDVSNILLDGFPRTLVQAEAAEVAIGRPDLVLFFSCPAEIARARYLTRALAGRDADASIFDRRYKQYEETIGDVLDLYRSKGVLEVDTSHETAVSYAALVRALDPKDIGHTTVSQDHEEEARLLATIMSND